MQQLLCSERLNLNGLDFSEIDAALMAQLLVHNATLTCARVRVRVSVRLLVHNATLTCADLGPNPNP